MCLDQMLEPWEHSESHNQLPNLSELFQILPLVSFIAICHRLPCIKFKINLQIHSSVSPKYSDVPLEIVRPLWYVLVLCKVQIFSDTNISLNTRKS